MPARSSSTWRSGSTPTKDESTTGRCSSLNHLLGNGIRWSSRRPVRHGWRLAACKSGFLTADPGDFPGGHREAPGPGAATILRGGLQKRTDSLSPSAMTPRSGNGLAGEACLTRVAQVRSSLGVGLGCATRRRPISLANRETQESSLHSRRGAAVGVSRTGRPLWGAGDRRGQRKGEIPCYATL